MNYQKFFIDEVPESLKKLDHDTKPQWGSMSSTQMLEHLCIGVKMSLENLDGQINTPEDKLSGYKNFLMSERPFGEGLDQPDFFTEHQSSAKSLAHVEDLKVELLKSLVDMYCYFARNKDHTAVHPSFGRLNTGEWRQLHKKHIEHHFRQFGLIHL